MNTRNVRQRQFSKRVGVVTEDEQRLAAHARLQALEGDEPQRPSYKEDSDEEFELSESDEGQFEGYLHVGLRRSRAVTTDIYPCALCWYLWSS